MYSLKNLLSATLHLFYPHVCAGCGSDLLENDTLLCLKCLNDLPYTYFAFHENNPVEKIFRGRIAFSAAAAEFYFAKGSLIQSLVHQLKYKGNRKIGFYLGELMGYHLLESKRFNDIDVLIPVPLYPDKERKRGYNQAAVICEGLSSVMQVPVLNNNLIRQRITDTQTRKHRPERWENVNGSFAIKEKDVIKDASVLLVDDVITTGATLEACADVLKTVENTRVYIAVLAQASK